MNAHLPSKKACSLSLLQGFATKQKKWLDRDNVPQHFIPTWPELSISKLWPDVARDPVLKDYFPDKYPKGKLPEKKFFWGILFAVKPGYAKALVKGALEERAAASVKDGEDRTKRMQFDPDILRRMVDAPHFLAKPRSGRSLLLTNMTLRQPSKKREYKVKAHPQDFAETAKRAVTNDDHDNFWNSLLRREYRPNQQQSVSPRVRVELDRPQTHAQGLLTKQSKNPFPSLLEGGPNEIFNTPGYRDEEMLNKEDVSEEEPF